VYLLDPGKTLREVPAGAHGLVRLVRNRPVLQSSGEPEPLPDPGKSLPIVERLAAACIAELATTLMARYVPTR
jgi:hypothetical protein